MHPEFPVSPVEDEATGSVMFCPAVVPVMTINPKWLFVIVKDAVRLTVCNPKAALVAMRNPSPGVTRVAVMPEPPIEKMWELRAVSNDHPLPGRSSIVCRPVK
jgi:hypothetical protein